MNAITKTEAGELQRMDDHQPSSSMAVMIERIVMDSSIPIDRLQQVLALKERMDDRERLHAREDAAMKAEKDYFTAMSQCQMELPVVIKRKKNTHTDSTYADLAAIEEQAMPVIHRHGFGVSFQPAGYNEKGELCIRWHISHSGGYSRQDVAGIPVDGAGSQGKVNKTGTQAFGSTATYGRRYLLCMLFNISTGDDKDGNKVDRPAKQGHTLSSEQVKALEEKIDEVNGSTVRLLKKVGVSQLEDIPAADFTPIMHALNELGARKATGETSNG